MSKPATIMFVRHDPKDPNRNHREDSALATTLAAAPPCWIILIGPNREKRKAGLLQALGVDGTGGGGVIVNAPVEVSWDKETAGSEAELPSRLATYLLDVGLPLPIQRFSSVVIRLPEDIDRKLLIAVTEAASVHPRVDIHLGAFIMEPSLRWEVRRDRFRAPPPGEWTTELVGDSPAIQEIHTKVRRYGNLPYPVLIIGETGTGKDVVAKMLHYESSRQGLYMPVNAARLPRDLAESLLFGHVKGAFTGADRERTGRIREAEGGTFFLDEAFNLDPAVQGKLLRALNRADEGTIEVEPLGSTANPVSVHARLVVAAQQDPRLPSTVVGGSPMRSDLYFRVAVGVIHIPPLRERPEDLPELSKRLLKGAGWAIQVSDDALSALRDHNWPGNVRELRLVLLRAVIDGPKGAESLTGAVVRDAIRAGALPGSSPSLAVPCDLALELKKVEVATMHSALRRAGGNAAEAGRSVGMRKNPNNFSRTLEAAEVRLAQLGGRHE